MISGNVFGGGSEANGKGIGARVVGWHVSPGTARSRNGSSGSRVGGENSGNRSD